MARVSEIAEQALLRRQQLPDAFGPGAVRPSYDGLGLVNVPALAAQILAPGTLSSEAFGPTVPPVTPALLEHPEVAAAFERVIERSPIHHVVLLLLDAVGYDQLNAHLAAGALPGLRRQVEDPDAFFIPLTSVCPSTTTTALAAAATARTPQEHGVMGTVNRLPELGSLVNLIHLAPAVGGNAYTERQLNPDTLVPVPNIYQRLEAAGVECEQVNYSGYQGSSISRFTSANSRAAFVGYLTPATAFATLRERLLSKPAVGRRKSFTYCYIGSLDGVAHRYGPLTHQYEAELAALDFSLNRELFERLRGRNDLLLCLVADHGQRLVAPEKVIWLHDHPQLVRLCASPVGGERRFAYLYLKPGTTALARRYLDTHLSEQVLTLTRAEALDMGLFGLPAQPVSPQAQDRLGDLLMVPRHDWIVRQFLTSGETGPGALGVHGGLSRAEMLIPFLAVRF